jgi:hypothetical protein
LPLRLVDPDLLGQDRGPLAAAEAFGVTGVGVGEGDSALFAHEAGGGRSARMPGCAERVCDAGKSGEQW